LNLFVLPTGDVSTTTKFDSTVTINGNPSPDDLSAFINDLLQRLTKSNIVDVKTAKDILAIYSIKGTGSLASSGTPSVPTSINFQISGEPTAATKFVKLITPILGQRNKLPQVAAYLLQLLIDNRVISYQDAPNLAVSYRIGVEIQVKQVQTQQQGQVEFPSGSSTTTKYDSTVTLSGSPGSNDLNAFINALLERLTKAKILDLKSAKDILAVFGIKGTGSLAGASSSTTTINFQLGG